MSDLHAEKKTKYETGYNLPGNVSLETYLVSYNGNDNDPYGASSMPIYQSATFKQPGATEFGPYDYTRSGNPTRSALESQVAALERSEGAKSFSFTTGMAAIACITRLIKCGEEVVVNDDSYGGTYRLMSKVAIRQGIVVKFVNLSGKDGPKRLKEVMSPLTRMVISTLIKLHLHFSIH